MGEDVSALGVGGQLNFVDRQEFDIPRQRHRLDGANEIVRTRRYDLLFAGDQRDRAFATGLDDPVIDFTRQQT